MRRLSPAVLLAAFAAAAVAQTPAKKADPAKKAPPAKKKVDVAPAANIKAAKGFTVEHVYTVPRDTQGSWVNLCVDPKGRIIASDQYGALYRVTPKPLGQDGAEVEPIPADIGSAQGLVWAFDALYVVTNGGKKPNALYRVTDSDGDDKLDKVEMLKAIASGGGEHGPHAVMLHPDGKRLTVVCGNQTKLMDYTTTKVPPVWGEDHLLPRMPDGNGFMKGVMGPGGAMYNVSPDGKEWELFSVGFRNQYDAAYNAAGELFTFDADMEWDMNTPWYRPTRVNHVTSGSEFGWRNGAGKFPAFYPDNLPGIVNIGPGSPTGVCFGYGSKFPAKYRNAFFISDWSYGKLYAVTLTPAGASYTAVAEEFVSGSPLALTDVIVNPTDGALYFAVGGRKTQSGLYRVVYTGPADGPEDTLSVIPDQVAKRKALEAFHGKVDPAAVELAWASLGDPDRVLRFAARVALEFQPASTWAEKALTEKDPAKAIPALLALTRVSASCPNHLKPTSPKADPALASKIVAALNAIEISRLQTDAKIDHVRVYGILFNRFGKPSDADRTAVLAKFGTAFPSKNRYLDGELLALFVYLDAPGIADVGVSLMTNAPTQEEQMEYARALRVLKTGWTPALRERQFQWFVDAGRFRGGNSLKGFMKLMKDDALATTTPEERTALAKLIATPPATAAVASGPARKTVKKWELGELAAKLDTGLGGRDFDRGRKLFGEAKCFNCHRFDNDGSSFGPDLSGVAGRFGPKDLLESVLNPDKEVSDQYAAVEIELTNGKKVVGRIVNLNGDGFNVNTDMLDPNATTNVKRGDIESQRFSKTSMMPAGLLDVLHEDEILDLLAYLLSRGDRGHAMFKK